MKQYDNLLIKIRDALSLCEEAGRMPILILMNSGVKNYVRDELLLLPSDIVDTFTNLMTLFGLPIIVNDKIEDFFIIDNRHWYEQKF